MNDDRTQPRFGSTGALWALTTCALLAAWGIHRLFVLALPDDADEGLAGLAVKLVAAVLGGLAVSAAARLLQRRRRGGR
ncbi:hypothetical protein [Kitasatospora sp. NPDC089509]|uniref:hypothetical protein n=1 Tax=Kitasatospora sp. NPDC089509 TaxID=3364079 RepID=UPI00382AC5E1